MNTEQTGYLARLPIQRVADLYADGDISHEQAEDYCDKWNASGKHFCRAYSIRYHDSPRGTMSLRNSEPDPFGALNR